MLQCFVGRLKCACIKVKVSKETIAILSFTDSIMVKKIKIPCYY
jgi:hypothetical protein